MKKIMMILIPVLLIGGVVGAGMMGVIEIPGLSPQKKKPPLPYGEAGADVVKKEAPKADPKPETKSDQKTEAPKTATVKQDPPKPDLDKGAKKLAKLWNSMQPDKILAMADKWKDPELARVLGFMEVEKAATVLSQMKPDRASKLSQAIQLAASVPKVSP